MLAMRKRKIANYLINPRFQGRFLLNMLSLALIVLVIIFAANSYFFHVFEQKGHSLGLPADHVFFKFITSQQETMLSIFLATGVVVVLLITIQGLRYSHKIAGPLYRLNQDMKSMATDGTLKTIKFRTGDYFPEIEQSFNQLITKIRED